MITLILSGRTTPSRPRDEAMAHLKSVHGPMVYAAPADAGPMPSLYVQNHVLDLPLPPVLEDWRWDRDLVTELSFEDIDHLRAATRTPYYLDHLRPDEARFVDHASVQPLLVPRPVIEGDAEDAAFKLFVYLRRGADLTRFATAWAEARRSVAHRCAAQAATLPQIAWGGPPAFVDGVWTLWFDTRADAEAFAMTRLEPLIAGFGDALSDAPGFIVLAEEYPVARLRRENAPALEVA